MKNTSPPRLNRSGPRLPARVRPPIRSASRGAENELSGLFPLLPNPGICMYVWPHLGGGGFPVPGYTTCFKMYERDEYALPGEVW